MLFLILRFVILIYSDLIQFHHSISFSSIHSEHREDKYIIPINTYRKSLWITAQEELPVDFNAFSFFPALSACPHLVNIYTWPCLPIPSFDKTVLAAFFGCPKQITEYRVKAIIEYAEEKLFMIV